MRKFTLYILFVSISFSSIAQINMGYRNKEGRRYRDKNYYSCNSVEGALVQFAKWQSPQFTNSNGKAIDVKMTPRFSYFFNMGKDYNYQVAKGVSLFTGMNLKNIGLIMEVEDVKTKHRVYTLGAPLGIRLHSADRKSWFKAGLELGWGLHYKRKQWTNGKNKQKYTEWFSNKTATFFPSLFAGVCVNNFSITANVYTNNFFNEFNSANFGYEANLFTVGVGYNLSKKMKIKKSSK